MTTETIDTPQVETMTFQAEVARILDIVVNSLYSDRKIFLRELISNAADACDRLRYLALTEPALLDGDAMFSIGVIPDPAAGTLTITDNGIGMDRDDLVSNLGTIAKSGSAGFLTNLEDGARKDVALIGQFGVGFYAAFMVASKVEVLSRKAGDDQAWLWTSEGGGAFTVAPAEKAARGTAITLHLKDDAKDFTGPAHLKQIIKTYSNHVNVPVTVREDGEDKQANAATALWTRPKSEITEEDTKALFNEVAQQGGKPWLALHTKAEGVVEYSAMLFVPPDRPMDLFEPEREIRVRLYVNRVMIAEKGVNLLPGYLRFIRGVVDSPDLPLNVSRELLQETPQLAKIRTTLVHKLLDELKKRAAANDGDYAAFWGTFGPLIKEGVYEDFGNHERLLPLIRAHSLLHDKLISLDDYVDAMAEGQEAIYYATGDNLSILQRAPQLEGFKAKGVDVLLLSDPIDEFWTAAVTRYRDHDVTSANHAGQDLSKVKAKEADAPRDEEAAVNTKDVATLIAAMKTVLGDSVADVRTSDRLTESPVCLVSHEDDRSIHFVRLMRQSRQETAYNPRQVLEINPKHGLIQGLAADPKAGDAAFQDRIWLLLDQARIVEGEPVPDPAAFARRMTALMNG